MNQWEQDQLEEVGMGEVPSLCPRLRGRPNTGLGIGSKYLCWRRTNLLVCLPLFLIAVLLPVFIDEDAAAREEGNYRRADDSVQDDENVHLTAAYRQVDDLEQMATLIWALCNAVALCFLISSCRCWLDFRRSQRLLAIAFLLSSIIPFCTYLWLPFRLSINADELKQGGCEEAVSLVGHPQPAVFCSQPAELWSSSLTNWTASHGT